MLIPETTANIILSALSVSLVVIIFVESRAHEIRAQTIANYLEVSKMYEHVQDLRLNHPEVAMLAAKWRDELWDELEGTGPVKAEGGNVTERKAWCRYYGYAETCLNFCVMTNNLYEVEGAISPDTFAIFSSLIDLLVYENRWFFASLLRVSKFIPEATARFLWRRLNALGEPPGVLFGDEDFARELRALGEKFRP
ncbi:MAG: hypothetical protein Kow0069_25750 [Promethearchaeota archaeon]